METYRVFSGCRLACHFTERLAWSVLTGEVGVCYCRHPHRVTRWSGDNKGKTSLMTSFNQLVQNHCVTELTHWQDYLSTAYKKKWSHSLFLSFLFIKVFSIYVSSIYLCFERILTSCMHIVINSRASKSSSEEVVWREARSASTLYVRKTY